MSSLRTQVLRGYKRLLKASQQAFKEDSYAIQQAKLALKENFHANRDEKNEENIKKMIEGIEEAESMLLYNIVQGRRKTTTEQESKIQYEVKLSDPQKKNMRKDEEIVPITPKSAEEPIVIRSGNICERPT